MVLSSQIWAHLNRKPTLKTSGVEFKGTFTRWSLTKGTFELYYRKYRVQGQIPEAKNQDISASAALIYYSYKSNDFKGVQYYNLKSSHDILLSQHVTFLWRIGKG